MGWETTSRYYSGQGVVLMGDTDANGVPTGLLPVGNVSDLKIAIAATNLEHKESQTGQRGTDLRLTTELKCSVSMTMESFSADNFAVAMRGGVTKKPGAAVTDEANKVYLGKVMPLKHAKVSAVTINKGASVLVAYTAGMAAGDWDYMLNADAGSILWATTPDTAGLADGDDVLVDYTYAAQQHVEPLTLGAPEKFIRFEGLNTAEELKPVIVEVFRFLTDPLKELALINDNVAGFQLEASALMDTRRTGVGESKYFRQIMVD